MRIISVLCSLIVTVGVMSCSAVTVSNATSDAKQEASIVEGTQSLSSTSTSSSPHALFDTEPDAWPGFDACPDAKSSRMSAEFEREVCRRLKSALWKVKDQIGTDVVPGMYEYRPKGEHSYVGSMWRRCSYLPIYLGRPIEDGSAFHPWVYLRNTHEFLPVMNFLSHKKSDTEHYTYDAEKKIIHSETTYDGRTTTRDFEYLTTIPWTKDVPHDQPDSCDFILLAYELHVPLDEQKVSPGGH